MVNHAHCLLELDLRLMSEWQRPSRQNLWAVTIIGGAIAAVIAAAVIGVWHHVVSPSPSPPSASPTGTATPSGSAYPVAAQQNWLNSCAGNKRSQSACECQLSYFEQHASYQKFEQDYSAMPPGVVPPQLDGAVACGN